LFQEEEFARSAPPINLPCLRCDCLNLPQWRAKANALIKLSECLLASPPNIFWSSIALRPQLLNEFDRALEVLPFMEDFKAGGPFCGLDLEPTVTELYAKIWALFTRICVLGQNEVTNVAIIYPSILSGS
jgi:hypothetical protein